MLAAHAGGFPSLLSTGALAAVVVAMELTAFMKASPYDLSPAINPSSAAFALCNTRSCITDSLTLSARYNASVEI